MTPTMDAQPTTTRRPRRDYRTPIRLAYVRRDGKLYTTGESVREWAREVFGHDMHLLAHVGDRLLTLYDVADHLGVPWITVWRWCCVGRRPYFRLRRGQK
jgi:hypothetical protein